MTGIPDGAGSSTGRCSDGNDEGAVRIDGARHSLTRPPLFLKILSLMLSYSPDT